MHLWILGLSDWHEVPSYVAWSTPLAVVSLVLVPVPSRVVTAAPRPAPVRDRLVFVSGQVLGSIAVVAMFLQVVPIGPPFLRAASMMDGQEGRGLVIGCVGILLAWSIYAWKLAAVDTRLADMALTAPDEIEHERTIYDSPLRLARSILTGTTVVLVGWTVSALVVARVSG